MAVPAVGVPHAEASAHPDQPTGGGRSGGWVTSPEFRADVIAATIVLGYYAWLLLQRTDTSLKLLIGTLSFTPLGLIVGLVQWRNARLAEDARTRLAWRLLAGASWSLWTSGNLWALVVFREPAAALPIWIKWAGMAYHVLNITGCLMLPSGTARRKGDLRFVFDAGLLATGAIMLALRFGLEQLLLAREDPSQISDLVSTVGNWLSFIILSIAYLRAGGTTRTVLALTLGTTVTGLVADSLLEILLRTSTYSNGDPIDGLWFGAWVLRWAAARYARHRYSHGPIETKRVEPDRDSIANDHSYFPYVILASGFLAVLLQVLRAELRLVSVSVISAATMTALLLGRQVIELRENRRLLAALRHQEARFRSLVQHSSDMVIVLDEGGRVTYLSPSVSRVVGANASWAAGMLLSDAVHPQDREALARLLSSPASGRAECRILDGKRWREVEIVSSDLRADAAVGGVVLNCRDVSERNELERELRHAQKIEAVGLLAGGIAHDFNNLLGVIKGHAELMKDDLAPDSQARDDADQIVRAADRAAAVTRKILAFTRKQRVEPVVVDVNQLLSDLVPMLRQLQGANVRLECQSGLRRVKVDPGQLEQVIVNLATNARDAMPGGGELRISTCDRTIDGETDDGFALSPGHYVAVSVTDSGVGMSEDVRARIFEPFFTTKPAGKGSGLGLAMVYSMVKEAGGGILVESAIGEGTVVTVLLPATADTPATTDADRLPHAPTTESRTVLLVDDEPDVREVARRVLDRGGFRVIEAADGFEALDIASAPETPIDVLVTDLVMPGMHGRDLAERFHAARPAVPIIYVTGFMGDAGDRGGPGEGVVAVLNKPVSADVLLRSVSLAHPVS